MSLVNYRAKYLKYKEKYLGLKGGKGCPTLGFHQHSGECWHDAYSMLMLYTDNISDNIFYVLENYTKDFETLDELVEDILSFAEDNENLQILLPLNINDDEYDKFKKYCRSYLTNLFNRYLNAKLKLAKDIVEPKKKKGVREMGLVRQNSFRESVMCTSSVYNILNINNLIKRGVQLDERSGLHETDLYFITSLLNYYLPNYILPQDLRTKTPEEIAEIPENYIYNQFVNFDIIFNPKNTTKDLISRLTQIKEAINNCHAVNIGIETYNKKLSPEGTFISNNQHKGGHMLCMFICDKKQYFYDDNGVNEYKQKGGVDTDASDASDASIGSVDEDLLREQMEEKYGEGIFNPHDAAGPQEIFKTFTEFNWKQYFSTIITKIIEEINNNVKLNIPTKDYYGSLRRMMSYFLHKNDIFTPLTFPHPAYNNYDIQNIQLYKLNKFEKGKTIAQKESIYYGTLIKMFEYWDVLKNYKIDQERINSFIVNSNLKMLHLLFKYDSNRAYITTQLRLLEKIELLKELEAEYKKLL